MNDERLGAWLGFCIAFCFCFFVFTIKSCNVEMAKVELEKIKIPHKRSVEVVQKASVESSGEQKQQ